MTKKIVASAGILAAITALITGAATYASLSTRTESVINSFQGACVNIGVVEKNNTGDVLVLEDEGTDDNGVYGENNSNNICYASTYLNQYTHGNSAQSTKFDLLGSKAKDVV